MAEIKIMGDALQVKTEITKANYNRIKAFKPDALKLFDEDKNEIFGIGYGDADLSKYGITFCSTDAENKMFMTTNNPVVDHSDPQYEIVKVTEAFAQTIHKLTQVEENVKAADDELNSIEASVTDAVTFA